ncbi:MAG: DNA repair protein RecO [Candidatus Bipolaricaulaceae bacterium]
MARLARAQGVVLRTQDYAETDRIAVLLTADSGRVDLLAKGARRIGRAWGAVLEPLNAVAAIYYVRSGLNLVRDVDLVRTFPAIRADLDRLSAALEGVRWAQALVPRDQEFTPAFRLTTAFLDQLEAGGAPRPLRIAYALRLLAAAGHGPHLAGCVRCGRQQDLHWSPEEGGLLCARCGGEGERLSPQVVRTLQALAHLPLPALARLRAPQQTLDRLDVLLPAFREVQLAR